MNVYAQCRRYVCNSIQYTTHNIMSLNCQSIYAKFHEQQIIVEETQNNLLSMGVRLC